MSEETYLFLLISIGLKPNVSHNASLIHLPKEYKHLSKGGGEILVEKTGKDLNIVFYTNRGMLDNFSGIVVTARL